MANYIHTFILLTFLILGGCDTPQRPIRTDTQEQKVNGRDGAALYQADVPSFWSRVDPQQTTDLKDTTKPITEFYIKEPTGTVRITVHNFPSASIDQRIPPEAQLTRWKSQLHGTSNQKPAAHDGYFGFFFEGTGSLDGQPAKVLGWAMQLAPEHYQAITSSQLPHYDQMRSDFTIKAVGPVELINQHQQEIVDFAESFRLIEEIPT